MICGSNYLFDCNYNFFNRQRTCIFYSYGFVHFENESDKDFRKSPAKMVDWLQSSNNDCECATKLAAFKFY